MLSAHLVQFVFNASHLRSVESFTSWPAMYSPTTRSPQQVTNDVMSFQQPLEHTPQPPPSKGKEEQTYQKLHPKDIATFGSNHTHSDLHESHTLPSTKELGTGLSLDLSLFSLVLNLQPKWL